MKEPVFNSTTQKILEEIAKKTPQSLLISGPEGVGLRTAAQHLTTLADMDVFVIEPEKDEKIDLENGIINIDIIRRLYGETRSKKSKKTAFIIDFAERMTVQAQNAFLKLLEEPGDKVHFILLSHNNTKMLPTILSRAEQIDVRPVSSEQSEKLLEALGMNDQTKKAQILFLAKSLPAEITRLATDDEYFEKRTKIMRDARELLQASIYKKLLIAQNYKDNRQAALILLSDAANILRYTLKQNPQEKSLKKLDDLLRTYQNIEANGNIRLCLAQIVL